MKLPNHEGREYRVLAIALVFFFIGLFFFLRDGASTPPSSDAQPKPSVSVQSVQSGSALDPAFANFPPPSRFRTFTYNGTNINGNALFAIGATCHDTYVAVLIFPATVDYRDDVNGAVYNIASPCSAGKIFTAVIQPSDMGGASSGTYYFFTADQGAAGTWYNPK